MFILPNTANNNFFLGKCWLHRFDIQFLDKWPLLLCFSQVDSLPNFCVRTQMITNWIQTLIYESRLSYRSETGLLEIAIRSVGFWKWRYLMTVVFRSVTFFFCSYARSFVCRYDYNDKLFFFHLLYTLSKIWVP